MTHRLLNIFTFGIILFKNLNSTAGSIEKLEYYIKYLNKTQEILSEEIIDLGQDLLIKSVISYVNNDYETSYECSQKALKIIPQLSVTHFLIAKTADIVAPYKYKDTKHKLTLFHMKIAIKLSDNSYPYKLYYYKMIDMYSKRNKYNKAALIFEEMISRFPSSVGDLHNLKKIYSLAGNDIQAQRVNNQINTQASLFS